jgi:hypothetical protein
MEDWPAAWVRPDIPTELLDIVERTKQQKWLIAEKPRVRIYIREVRETTRR